ncbi:PilZ domain-containing protein [Novosphingobium sp. FKTRR1]|uniref:PilZ domain-containing protein n=1 Tax=unclassified Novosphingobium TaxID=2644732 RepID=UPI001CEFC48C|nr:PilZ domain-containing protein [Novosphingobium sp. FKTRR1]
MSVHVPPPVSASHRIGRRKAARVRLGIPVTLILLDGHHKCWLLDLSQSGAGILATGISARLGESAVLEACGHEAFGIVVRRHADLVALEFEELLPMPAIVEIRNFSDSYRAYEQAQQRRHAREFVQGRKSRC